MVGERHSPMPTGGQTSEMAEMVRDNLPTCASVADAFKAEFGSVRLVYASENGHELGKRIHDGVPLSETLCGPMVKQTNDKRGSNAR